jgi:hypothetical protein
MYTACSQVFSLLGSAAAVCSVTHSAHTVMADTKPQGRVALQVCHVEYDGMTPIYAGNMPAPIKTKYLQDDVLESGRNEIQQALMQRCRV